MINVINEYNIYKTELSDQHPRWFQMNDVLYKMCEDNPFHDSIDLLAGKFCIIGRSYSAAIERRNPSNPKIKEEYRSLKEDDIYYIGLNRIFFSNNEWKTLDDKISYLKSVAGIEGNEEVVLDTHRWLTDIIGPLTGYKNVSFVSKCLHFHCPKLFFLYDNRAKTMINELLKNSKIVEVNFVEGDLAKSDYGRFYRKMISLQNFLKHEAISLGPREMDDFLLWLYSRKKK